MMTRILVIDDEPNIRLILKMALSEEGYEIFTAATGEEGLKILKDRTPALVLIDLNMPVLNGKDFLALIKKDENYKKIPVILLTGSLAGVEDFPPKDSYQYLFEKPFDLFAVEKAVSDLIGHEDMGGGSLFYDL